MDKLGCVFTLINDKADVDGDKAVVELKVQQQNNCVNCRIQFTSQWMVADDDPIRSCAGDNSSVFLRKVSQNNMYNKLRDMYRALKSLRRNPFDYYPVLAYAFSSGDRSLNRPDEEPERSSLAPTTVAVVRIMLCCGSDTVI